MIKNIMKNTFISLCIVMSMILLSVQGYAVEDKQPFIDEGCVLSDKLQLSKDIVPYGKAQDRIYQVNLSVTGELETFIRDAHVFLLIDLTPLNQNVFGMWSYYMRAVWNMCYKLIEDHPRRTFYFHFIAYNHTSSPIVSESFKASYDHQEQLGNPLDIYTKDGKPIYESGQMYHYYNPILNEHTLLGILSKISKYSLPQFEEGHSQYESMDYPDSDLVCHIQKYPQDYINADTNVYNVVNLEGALKEMNRIIEKNHLKQAQAILLADTLPSASVGGLIASQGEIEKAVDVLKRTYDEYEISKKEYKVLFHVFGLKAYTGNQEEYEPLWQEFIKAIGENKTRQKISGQYVGGYFDNEKQEYVPYQWDQSIHEHVDNDYQFEWDHLLGSEGDVIQKRMIRIKLNNSLKEVGKSVGDGLVTVPNYANIVYLQDIIPQPFHIYETKDLHDQVTTSSQKDLSGVVGRVDRFIKNSDGSFAYLEDKQTFQAKDRWKSQGIRWKLNRLLSDDGTYTFTYYIQANEDYFGGEVIPANQDAAIYYMSYEQWVNVGCPQDDSDASSWESKDFTKEDFIYQIENGQYVLDEQGNYVRNPQKSENTQNDDTCHIDVYVPCLQETKDGKIRIFYGDEVQIKKSSSLSTDIFEDMKGHNDTTSPIIHYYYQQFPIIHESYGDIFSKKENWKDKAGEPLKFHYVWNVLDVKHQPLYVMEEGDGYLGDIVSDFVIEPDDTLIYQLSYTLLDNQNIKSVAGTWDSLMNGGEIKAFGAYKKTSVDVFIDVVFGSLRLEKDVIGNHVISSEEIEKIGLQTGFPIDIQGPISTIPTLRYHEDITLTRLKRGIYKLREIVPQKFLLHCYEDQYRYIGNDKVVSQNDYEIEIGFDEGDILQDNSIIVKNEVGLKEWESAITEIDNLFEIKEKDSEVSK